MTKLIFIGAFEPNTNPNNPATSAAGNLVQNEILSILVEEARHLKIDVFALSHKPARAWPYGAFFSPSGNAGCIRVPAFINLPVFKHLNFGFALFYHLVVNRPKIAVAYNPGPFENLALLVYRLVAKRLYIVSIIQDIHTDAGHIRSLRALSDYVSMRMARQVDLTIPISSAIVKDFKLSMDKALIFRGGMTRQCRQLLNAKPSVLKPYAVFAGALESYNGIDVLLPAWIQSDNKFVLHVFGKGALSALVSDYARKSDRIVFHGFQNEVVIETWQSESAFNFCLRYSKGIDQRYFFPSKFFSAVAAPGVPVANNFYGFPDALIEHCYIVDDDLNNLNKIVDTAYMCIQNNKKLTARRQWLEQNAEWKVILSAVLWRFYKTLNVDLK